MAPSHSPGLPLQEDVVQTTTVPAADGTAIGQRVIGQAGFVTFVAPQPFAAGLRAAIYAVVTLQRTALGSRLVLLWAGYIRSFSGGAPSRPGAPCENGDIITLTVSASTTFVAGAIAPSVLFRVDAAPGPVLPVVVEPPGPLSGPGDAVTVALGNPASNADYAAVTVGAQTLERVLCFACTPAVKTLAGGLMFRVTDGTNLLVDVPASIEVGATGLNEVVGMPGPIGQTPSSAITQATSRAQMGLPTVPLMPADVWQLKRDNPHAADDWNAAFARVERWARP
jgi:hypothetical protein